jgi:hypothetical protein
VDIPAVWDLLEAGVLATLDPLDHKGPKVMLADTLAVPAVLLDHKDREVFQAAWVLRDELATPVVQVILLDHKGPRAMLADTPAAQVQ